MEAVWIALVVAAAGIVGPLFLSHLTARQRRQERVEDYARQDQVAAQVAAAADQAAEAAALLLDANERVADTAAVTNGKLDVIHTLVNSNMTAAMRGEHAATVRELVMMVQVADLHRDDGREPSVATLAAIEATRRHVDELATALDDRLRQTAVAEQQIANSTPDTAC